jgi:Cd2+/Zn2+-exporting ATPase
LGEFIYPILIGATLMLAALLLPLSFWAKLVLYLASYLLVGRQVVFRAFRNIFTGRIFDEATLMTIATGGALVLQEFPEAISVMLFYRVGEFFEALAVDKSRRSITGLMDIRPDYANLKKDDMVSQVAPEQVIVGDTVIVKPGEKVPLDGQVITGESLVDASALTGESRPKRIRPGDEILSGMINRSGVLEVRVSRPFGQSTVSKILHLVEAASARKAPTERFITRFARIYTPAVVGMAVAIAVGPVLLYKAGAFHYLYSGVPSFDEWIYRALIFLVISCPCALVLSIPLGFFAGVGAASRNGILVKGSNYLEGLNRLGTVVFDKTGTLTEGVFKVTEIVPADGFNADEILRFAAKAESHASHPIASSIIESHGQPIDESAIEEYEEISGVGVRALVEGHEVLAGSDMILHMQGEDIEHDTCHIEGTIVHVAVDRKYAGYLVISDELKKDAAVAISRLRSEGIDRLLMLTGDSNDAAEAVSGKLGLDGYHAQLLPHQKVEKVEELVGSKSKDSRKIAFVGDGVNDAPVLARADIGVAMGALGSDAAIEAADVVLMTDEPSKLADAVVIARKTRSIVIQNIVLVFAVKGFFLAVGAMGKVTMWEAVFADVGVALLAVLNSTRILRVKRVL